MAIILVIYLALCGLVAYFGRDCNLGPWAYLAISLVLSPLIGIIAVLVSDKNKSPD